MDDYAFNRNLMKAHNDEKVVSLADIAKGVPQPAHEKPYPEDARKITLPHIDADTAPKADLFTCISERVSRRNYSHDPLSLQELAFLLWCTQGVKGIMEGYRKYVKNGEQLIRPVPSGGARNPYETYLAIHRIEGVEQGIWRYLPLSHELLFVSSEPNLSKRLVSIFSNPDQDQHYITRAAVVFFWTALPYRGEWRYRHTSHRIMLIDVGHICQNLYLSVEAIGCGCTAIGGYLQKNADDLLQIDGENEFTVLCASVGRKNEYKELTTFYRHITDFVLRESDIGTTNASLHSNLLEKVERMTDPSAFVFVHRGIKDMLERTRHWKPNQVKAVDEYLLHHDAPTLSEMREHVWNQIPRIMEREKIVNSEEYYVLIDNIYTANDKKFTEHERITITRLIEEYEKHLKSLGCRTWYKKVANRSPSASEH